MIKACRYGAGALCSAADLAALNKVNLPSLSTSQSHTATVLLCAFGTLLLCVWLVCREKTSYNKRLLFAANQLSDAAGGKRCDETLLTLASIVEHSEDAIIGKTNDNVIVSWNAAAEKIFGYAKAEAIGQNISVLIPPDKQDEFFRITKGLREGQSIECLETQRRAKNGTILNVSLSIFPIKDSEGRVIGAFARDITLRKRADKQLRLQSAALEAAANAIVITDQHGTIVWVNRAFTKLTGYSEEEILGKNPRLFKSGEQPQSYYANLWATIASGKVWQGEIVNRRKNGTTYTEEMTITPVFQASGNGDHT
ncbi:MAG TPA: PAS domain-containing protein, partial [Terriglobales bacterium]|nr:PAS domain-containing protein [Terriglobales bacterium]